MSALADHFAVEAADLHGPAEAGHVLIGLDGCACAVLSLRAFLPTCLSGSLNSSPPKEGPDMFRSLSAFALAVRARLLRLPRRPRPYQARSPINPAPPFRARPSRSPARAGRCRRRLGSRGEYSFPNLAERDLSRSPRRCSGFAPATRDVVVSGSNVEVPAITLALAEPQRHGRRQRDEIRHGADRRAGDDERGHRAKCWRARRRRTTATCCARCRA